MKRVLCLYFSQTGQLENIVRSLTTPLAQDDRIELVLAEIRPQQSFPFPWPFTTFFNTFPETVYADPVAVEPLPFSDEELQGFDLVILGYQVWFLSPSLPIASFLQSRQAEILLRDKPVITVIGCRNMWLMAQETMKTRLAELGARLIDNVVLTDSAGAAMSFISTPMWMLTGNKGPLGPIPAAGVSDEKIRASERFGRAVVNALHRDTPLDAPLFRGLGAVEIHENLIASEKVAKRGFLLWGRLIRFVGNKAPALRKPVVYLYVVYLVTLILTVVPLSALIKKLLSPLLKKRIQEQVRYFAEPSGNETYNL